MRAHGWAGLCLVGVAAILLAARDPTVAGWFTPIVWTGYVLFVDALAARFTGRSYLTTDRVEGVLVALASLGCWWLFELYNARQVSVGGTTASNRISSFGASATTGPSRRSFPRYSSRRPLCALPCSATPASAPGVRRRERSVSPSSRGR